MPDYYVYTLGNDGHIVDRQSIICESDEEAKERAKQLVNGHPVELWQEARKVARFMP
jgi:hypothetical protein